LAMPCCCHCCYCYATGRLDACLACSSCCCCSIPLLLSLLLPPWPTAASSSWISKCQSCLCDIVVGLYLILGLYLVCMMLICINSLMI
jgi:hypothetical protein